MKPGSKYHSLFDYLRQRSDEQILLSFGEIEGMIGSSLPPSARDRKNWWSNRDGNSALQAGAWIGAGYKVQSVDLLKQTVQFCKFQARYDIQREDGAIVWHQDAIKALRKHMKMTQAQFAKELGVRRQTVSEWENGVYDPDRKTGKFLELVARQANFTDISEGKENN
ncbi:MAG: helix-turn-helix transcriptional regulator [Cyanobacteria bacterium P01_E01_bin.6]